jgi:ribonucleoside-diphosphate reductase alpha chain
MDVYIDEVVTIEDGTCNTYDLSVPDNKTYIANGFISHNTTGTMVNTSTGIEPFFSWMYYRKSRLGLHEEQVPLVKEWFEQHPGETKLPDYFVTAMDLTPEEHVRVQAAIQRWVDSSISKCVVGDTLILTEEGLQPIEELSECRESDTFVPLDINVATSNGSAKSSAFYYNGMRPTIKVKLSYGYGLEGTLNHPIRVLQAEGTIAFRQLSELTIGDVVPVYIGQRKFGLPNKRLPVYEGNWDATNTKQIRLPAFMTNELAFLLGCITSEGSIGRNGVHFVNGDRGVVEKVARLFEDIFGIRCLIERDIRRDSLWYMRANSRVLCRWLTNHLGLMSGASNKVIPSCILASSEEEISHFLRGLFLDAYMTLDGRMFGIGLASLKLLKQLQVLFLNMGILARLHKSGPNAWAITVAGESLDRLAQVTAFEEVWKNERIARRNENRQMKHRNYATLLPAAVSSELYQAAKVGKRSLRSLYYGEETDYQRVRVALMRSTKIRREDARKVYNAFADTSNEYLKNFFTADSEHCIYLEVKGLESGFAEVFDITVPSSHEFIANGICNHNTANLPQDYTVEQTRELYEYMYALGCKGGTIYRDGSRDEQVLMLKGDERAESEMERKSKGAQEDKVAQVATPHHVYPRPPKLTGVTVSRKTPFGTAFITMNSDEHGNPFEVFITVGKAGSDLQADAEGLGRMLSLQLRTTAPQNRKEMLKLIVDQLQGIGGARSIGLGPMRVASLPDAVAGALIDHYYPKDEAQQLGLFNGGVTADGEDAEGGDYQPTNGVGPTGAIRGADICPSCKTVSLIRVEGCRKCLVCGYSDC